MSEVYRASGSFTIDASKATAAFDETEARGDKFSKKMKDDLDNTTRESSRGFDKFGATLGKTGNNAEKLSKKMRSSSIAMGGALTLATNGAIGLQDQVANISTLLDDNSHLDGYKNKIMEVSNETGKSIDIVADGMYQAISSIGDGGKETEKIFDTMADGAKAGGADVSDSVALISAGMKGYGSVNDATAKKISDLAFQTAKLGVTTFPEMAKSMQPLFPLSSSLNLKMTDLFGSMATLTGVTGNTAEVSTQLKAVMGNLMKPTSDMQKVIEKYGYSNAQSMIKARGLGGVLKILQKETGGQSDKMAKLFSSTEAMTAMTALCGQNFNDFTTKTKAMGNATGSTDKALQKINETTGNDLRTSMNSAKNSLISFGDAMSPIISIGSKGLTLITKGVNSLSSGTKKAIVTFGTGFIATNLLLGGFAKLSKGIASNITFTKNLITHTKNGINNIKDFAKATKEGTNLLGKFNKNIVKGSKGIGGFGKKLITTTGKGLKGFGKGVINGTKTVASFTKTIALNSASAIKNGAIWVANKGKLLAHKTAQLTCTVATKAMTVAQKGLNLALRMNPIGIVITILLALAAVFVTLYNKCDWFRNGVNKVWSSIKSTFTGFANFFKGAFSRDWTQTLGILGVPINAFFGKIKAIIGGVKGVFNGLIKFFKGVFTGNWKEAFQGLSDIVTSIFGAIGGVIKAPINSAISGINMAIRGVNKLSFTTPDWLPGGLGGKHFGFHIPSIPALANGGIVTQATMALVGEGQEHEAVMPLSKLDSLVTNSIRKVIGGAKNVGTTGVEDIKELIEEVRNLANAITNAENNINLVVDSRVLARTTAPAMNIELARIKKGGF